MSLSLLQSKRFTRLFWGMLVGSYVVGSVLLVVFVFFCKYYWMVAWKAHVAFALSLSFSLWLPFFLFYKNRKSSRSKNLLLAVSSLSIILFFTEIVLCLVPVNKTYTEQSGFNYASPYFPSYKGVFHILDTAHPVERFYNFPEFILNFHVNKLGFSGKEWLIEKAENKKRVITLGDSFTMGVGAVEDSTYPVLLAEILGKGFEVLNAGVMGSDPVFNYENMEKRLLQYKPDIVLQTVSGNDIYSDFGARGGFERFVNDSTLKFKAPPVYEPLYAVSYTSRLFFNVLGLIPGAEFYQVSPEENNRIILDLLNRYEKLAAANNFTVWVVFYPLSGDMENGTYNFDCALAKKHITSLKHTKYIDLMPCYTSKMGQNQDLIYHYYWKQDKHHNGTGYQLMANCIADELQKE